MTTAEKLKTFSDNVPKVFEAGKKSEYDMFWDAFQDFGKRNDYRNSFSLSWWDEKTFKPKYDIVLQRPGPMALGVFEQSNIVEINVPIQIKNNSYARGGIFRACRNLKKISNIVLSGGITFTDLSFENCSSLSYIRFTGTFDSDNDFSGASALSKDTVYHIFDRLSDIAVEKYFCFNASNINNLFGINCEDPNTYPPGSEYYELINTKPNWSLFYF